jgi:hypothetical protein
MSVGPFSERQERLPANLPRLVIILLGIGCGSLEKSALIN